MTSSWKHELFKIMKLLTFSAMMFSPLAVMMCIKFGVFDSYKQHVSLRSSHIV